MTDICNIHCEIQTTACINMYQEQQNDSFTSDKSGSIENSQVLETKVGIDKTHFGGAVFPLGHRTSLA